MVNWSKIKHKFFSAVVISVISALVVTSCFPPPELPDEPKISLQDVSFIPSSVEKFDTMRVIIHFEDGDGDLGLRSTETDPPYQDYTYVTDGSGDTLTINSPGAPPFNCTDYKVDTFTLSNGIKKVDTNYIERNERHFNYLIDVLVKDNGKFEKYDFLNSNEDCSSGPGPLGRFPILNSSGKERPLEGDLEFTNTDLYRLTFRKDTIKLRISIYDRAGHKSNPVESKEFYIDDKITKVN